MFSYRWIPISFFFLLAACGGGGGNSPALTSNGTLSVYATDNITTQFREVWVTLKSVSAEDESDNVVTLFEDRDGTTINLAALDNIGSLLSAQDLAAGTYDEFRMVLDSNVQLVALDGTVVNAALSSTDTEVAIVVPGSVTIEAGDATAIAFDFDLEQFIYDADSGLVAPVIEFMDDEDVKTLSRRYAEIEGTVVEVLSADSFILRIEDSTAEFTVNLHAVAGIALASANGVIKDANLLKVDDNVEVFGNVDTDLLAINAVRVQIVKSGRVRLSAADKVSGQVVSFDGSTLVIDVKDASFLPGGDTLTIANVTSAKFIHGALSQLIVDQWIQVRGNWDGATFQAKLIDIEGADVEDDAETSDYAEITGVITAVDNGTLTLSITDVEGLTLDSDVLSVNIANAWMKNGDATCIATGVTVEVKGSVRSNEFSANIITIESGCAAARNAEDASSVASPISDAAVLRG